MVPINRKFIAAAAAFALSAAFAQENAAPEQTAAGQKVTLTVQEAVDFALENSRTLKTADIDLEIKARAGKNAWNVLLPDVTATGTLNRSKDSLYGNYLSGAWQQANMGSNHVPVEAVEPRLGLEDNESSHWTGCISLSVDWNLSLAYIYQIRSSKANYEIGKITYDQSIQDLKVNVQKLFYGLLLQQESLGIQEASLENARKRAIQAETNYRNGLVPELSMLQAQVTYENLRPDVEKAQRELRQQFDTFAFLLGLPVGTELTLSGTIEPVFVEADVDSLIAKYGENSLDLQSLDKNLDVLKMNLTALNLSTYTPFLKLGYAWTPTLGGYALDGSNWSDFPNDGYWKDQGSFSITVGWNLTNLLPFSANRQQAKDLQANISKLEINRENLLENQKMQVREAVDKLTEARQQIDAMGRNISLAQRSYDMTVRSYNNGRTELLDVRDAENQLEQAKLGLANQKFNYISALLDLESILNTNLISAGE